MASQNSEVNYEDSQRQNLHSRPNCTFESSALSFSIAILIMGFGGALFSQSFSKFVRVSDSDSESKVYLQAAMIISIFQAINGFCVAVIEWMEIRKGKWSLNTNPLRWICLFFMLSTLIGWIFIVKAIATSSEVELLQPDLMVVIILCNCILLCISCLVLPKYTMCFEANNSIGNNEKIVIVVIP